MKQAKWNMSILKKFNSTSHTKILSYLKNELIKHPINRVTTKRDRNIASTKR
ncbi:hypothetical protein EV11_1456 [Prochlorococcus sp. SS52]|uniref:Uncharacterized protein n=1 Tax=Prochlorococcus marinus (strain SARG / CCMP1375 / SS120) TaxID=167539 RepID=Q7VBW5_PROMA|nr:Predicted protein [Prochlorococcus marinus subsp. marinus str. CCMP1375]KGG13817.1 hypothetical protein EV04_0302 [Prochlorococcus marinus str. LG]KGG18952.1 hypothetical protein EV08_1439 [Prochlorococcus marinus str. SS2]KGG23510.1 hypothetical protein EV09_1134 [Prochlorococcus marinus str. SS35]KGG32254.1 hypothetical protein EV10_1369 [Prochlorococcus marinus str. SS51]KGG35054.1 hypothetical protein EV11_1456 [Prochlorococcus sp. SS52]